jgi:hypothetical protein
MTTFAAVEVHGRPKAILDVFLFVEIFQTSVKGGALRVC